MLWMEDGPAASMVLTIIFGVLFMLYVGLFIHCGRGIRRLRRIVSPK